MLPGIEATFCAFCAEEATFRHAAAPGVLEAHYCRCGRVGWNMRGGLSVFLGAGDLTLHGGACCADSAMQFPLGYAETVGIAFDLAQLAEHPPRALRDAGFQPLALRESLCGGRPAAIPACPALEHIFAPLCAAPPPLRPSYLQLKALELLLALDGLRARAAKLAPCAAQQAERIRAAHALLTGDLRRRYTIEALAKRFLLNTSALKEGFKAVYGAPIALYVYLLFTAPWSACARRTIPSPTSPPRWATARRASSRRRSRTSRRRFPANTAASTAANRPDARRAEHGGASRQRPKHGGASRQRPKHGGASRQDQSMAAHRAKTKGGRNMAVYLGIDLGTTGLKALLLRPDGTACGAGYREYPLAVPAPGFAEQDPDDWWRALTEATAEALARSGVRPEEVRGIGLSGQMHGTVLLDAGGAPLGPAIPWCDQRSAAEADAVRARIGAENLARWTQNPVAAGFQLCTLLWLRAHEPKRFARARWALLPKDYLRLRLTGEAATEPTDACSTLMFDCARRDWSAEMLAALDIDRALLPDARHAPADVHAGLSAQAARALGLRAGTPVAFGGGDQPMQALGNGILEPGDASITLGTGGQIFAPVASPARRPAPARAPVLPRPGGHVVRHGRDPQLLSGAELVLRPGARHARLRRGSPPRGAGRARLRRSAVPALPDRRAHAAPRPAREGHVLRPDAGVPTAPRWRAPCSRASVTRCSTPWTACARWAWRRGRLTVSGGGARSELWKQILADMMGQPRLHHRHARTGGHRRGDLRDGRRGRIRQPRRGVPRDRAPRGRLHRAIPANTALYRERHARFQALYAANRALFAEN